jgi:hypothetical protein
VAAGNVVYSSAGALGFCPWVNADRSLLTGSVQTGS